MTKYKIKIEALDPAEELRAEYRMGIECEGFCIIADKENGYSTSIHHMSTTDIAEYMANDKHLMACVCLARGMFEAGEVERRFDRENRMAEMLKGMAKGDD